jgi:hypothetical protein
MKNEMENNIKIIHGLEEEKKSIQNAYATLEKEMNDAKKK